MIKLRRTRIKFITGDDHPHLQANYELFAEEHADCELVSITPHEIDVEYDSGYTMGHFSGGPSLAVRGHRRQPAVLVVLRETSP